MGEYAFGVVPYTSPRPGVWVVDLRKSVLGDWGTHYPAESVVTDCAERLDKPYGGLYGEHELTICGLSGSPVNLALGADVTSYGGELWESN